MVLAAVRQDNNAFSDAFRAAMKTFTGTVSLITTCTDGGEWRGIAATAVTSISMDPPTCLICINRETTLFPALASSKQFCINGLHQDHHEIVQSFTNSEHRERRFQSGSWRRGYRGMPFLENAQSNIFCETFQTVSVGTHDVVFGRVVDVMVRGDHDPLLYGYGKYHRQSDRKEPSLVAG